MEVSSAYRTLRGIKRRLLGKPWQTFDVVVPHLHLGTSYGGYAVELETLGADSVVYSFGLGEDISFDLALMERCGCQVYGFDPTPRSVSWVRAQNPPAGFHLREVGLAAYDGTASFAPPKDPTHVSHSMSAPADTSAARIEFQVRKLSTLTKELGHERLDVLKMDIEGAEYDVIDDFLKEGLRPRQFLVEFHHGQHGIARGRTEATLRALQAAGYAIFDAQPTGHEFSLVLRA